MNSQPSICLLRAAIVLLVAVATNVQAQSFDRVIDKDQDQTVELNKPGTTVLVEQGVSLSPVSGRGILGLPGDDWHITNRGTIGSGTWDVAIELHGSNSVVINQHVIQGGQVGIIGRGGLELLNVEGATVSGQFGLAGSGNLLLNNRGTISGSSQGIGFDMADSGSAATISNSGRIEGGYAGIGLYTSTSSTASSSIRNLASGEIHGTGPQGMGLSVLHGRNFVDNEAGALIAGSASGVVGRDLFTYLDVRNAGSIRGGTGAGIWSYGGGPIANMAGASISGAGGVAYVRSRYNSANTLSNAGTIIGNGATFIAGNGPDAGSGTGVYIGAVHEPTGTYISNEVGGLIRGSFYGIYSGAAVMESDAGPVTVSNAGTIEGDTGVALNGADGTIVNRGTITGTGGIAVAFDQTGSFTNTLTLDTGSVLNGNVLGGAGFNELILQGRNTEDLFKFRNLHRLTMQGSDWTLTGSGSFGNAAQVGSGTLRVDGRLTSPLITVASGATLAGSGTLIGDVLNEGTLAPGGTRNPVGTLTIDGNLTLAEHSMLDFQLGAAGATSSALNDRIDVSGNLTLDGILNVSESPGGTFGPGLYRLFNYGGTLTDHGLVFGRMPAGSDSSLMTAIAGQVNLVNRGGVALSYWDGDSGPRFSHTVDGGDGIWRAAGDNNWTDTEGRVNAAYTTGSFATFAGKPGAVTVDDSRGAVVSAGMQFAIGGYRVQGGPITLAAGNNVLRVGDGTAAGGDYVATLASALQGAGDIEKTDLGTLELAGANTYTGSTTVTAGTLRTGASNVLSQSREVIVQHAGTLDLNGHDQVANRLAGDGRIELGAATLTTRNATEARSSEFKGVLSGLGGLTKTGAGTLTLSGQTLYRGETRVEEGQLVLDGTYGGARLHGQVGGLPAGSLALRNGAELSGTISGPSLAVDAASRWSIAASSYLNQLSNAGMIGFTAPAFPMTQGRSLTVQSLQGLGGSIRLYTALGANDSISDRIVVDGGRATGLSVLEIHNAGGLGDQTAGDGIPVVVTTNGGTTEAGAFALGRPVLAGPYRYSLRRGGRLAGDDWFLVSGRGDDGGAGTALPDYRAETSLYSALQAQAVRYGDAVLGTLHQRRGADADIESGRQPPVWMRILGQRDRSTGANSGMRNKRVRGEADVNALQLGVDLYGVQLGDRSVRTGVYGAVGRSKGKADHADARGMRSRAGENDLTAYSLGLYGTWLNGQGGYIDTVLQGTYYDAKSRSHDAMKLSTGGRGLAASVEAGQRIPLAAGLTLQPQAQVVYQRLKLRDARDAAGRVAFPATDTAQLRLGARLSQDLAPVASATGTAWASADLLHRVGGTTRTRFSTPTQGDVGFANDLPGTWLRVQMGLDGQLSKRVSGSARLGVERSIDGADHTSIGGQVGLKMVF